MRANRLLLCAALGWVPLLVGPADAAMQYAVTSAYDCDVQNAGRSDATSVSFTLSESPDSITAGTKFALRAELKLQLPTSAQLTSKLALASNASLESSDFSVTAIVNGKETLLKPSELKSEAQPISTPFVVTAELTYPEMAIPASASGVLVLKMPAAPAENDGEANKPTEAFSAVLAQDSQLMPTRRITCNLPADNQAAAIARVPIDDAGVSSPAPSDAEASPDPSTGELPAISGPAVAGELSTAVPQAPVAQQGQVPAEAPVALVQAPIPPSTVRSGTFVPTRSLITMGALLPATALLIAARQRALLRAARAGMNSAHPTHHSPAPHED